MQGTLPGTTIEASLRRDAAEDVLAHIFAGGGVVLSQIAVMTALEPHVIQNWVKRGYLSPPQHRQYTKRQFVRVAIINLLRQSLQLDRIVELLSYVNGKLADESDDRVDDVVLYNMLLNVLLSVGEGYPTEEAVHQAVTEELEGFEERFPGDRRRVHRALCVMVWAHLSALAKQKADMLLRNME